MNRRGFKKCMLGLGLMVAVVLGGCESVDVDPETAASGGGGGGGGTPPETGTVETRIAINPEEAVHTSTGNYTILEVSPIPGYTFTWTLSDPSLGTLTPTRGERVTYFTTRIPSTGSAIQIITARGRHATASVVYIGTSRITHEAD